MKPKVLMTDGEGPIVYKDLAADITSNISFQHRGQEIPGSDLFGMLSLYDDYLVEVGTAGYQAGDTLAIVVPHFIAHGITNQDVLEAARSAKVCSGVEDYVAGLKKDGWEIRIISTSYSQMWELVGSYLGIPMEHIASTELDLEVLSERFGKDFRDFVLLQERRILDFLPLAREANREVTENRKPIVDVFNEPGFQPLRNTLDGFYFRNLPNLGYRALEEVKVVGGKRKVEAARRFAQEIGVPLSGVAYVGDSITDDELFAELKREGGLPIAVNGNMYALRNARVGVATNDMRFLRPVLDAWNTGAMYEVSRFVENSGRVSVGRREAAPVHEKTGIARYDLINIGDTTHYRQILEAHRETRVLVRGAAAAKLS